MIEYVDILIKFCLILIRIFLCSVEIFRTVLLFQITDIIDNGYIPDRKARSQKLKLWFDFLPEWSARFLARLELNQPSSGNIRLACSCP